MKKIFSIFTFLLLFFLPASLARASGASLYLSPNNGTFYTGNTFDVSVTLNSGGNDVNALKVDMKFDPKKLQVVNPAAGKSFIAIWIVPPSYSNMEGALSFQGGIPSPGINTSSGSALTVTFRAVEPGEASIHFLGSSKVLLDDGNGTDILNSLGDGKYIISLLPPEGPNVSSPTHPDQNRWYKNNDIAFSWDKAEGATDFSYDLDSNPRGIPDDNSEGGKPFTAYSDQKDGVWYFHIKAKEEEAWGGVSHYLVRIDNSSPASFTVEVSPSKKTSFSQPIVSFLTTDGFSQLDHYNLKLVDITASHKNKKEDSYIEVSSPYQLPALETGKYIIIVKAFDKAGNWREESAEIEITPEKLLVTERGVWLEGVFLSWWPILLTLLLLLILILSALIILWQREKKCKMQLTDKLRKKERLLIKNFESLRG